MKRASISLALVLPLLFFSRATLAKDLSGAQPPSPYGIFSTFSSDSPEKRRAVVAFKVEKSSDPDFHRISSQFGFGLTNSVEAGMNVPYVDNSKSGLEDVAFYVKHRFLEKDMWPSLGYLVIATLASSTEEFSTDGSLGGGFVISQRVGPVQGHVNLILLHPWDSDLDEEFQFLAGVEFSAAHNFDVLAEFFLRESYFGEDDDQQEIRLGYRFSYGEKLFTSIGAGFGLNNKPPEWRLMASLSFLFPIRSVPIEKVYEEGE
jgi:hypothetical protein